MELLPDMENNNILLLLHTIYYYMNKAHSKLIICCDLHGNVEGSTLTPSYNQIEKSVEVKVF